MFSEPNKSNIKVNFIQNVPNLVTIIINCLVVSRFGPHSIEVGHELIKYTDVLLGDLQDTTKRSSQYGEKLIEARVCLERASQIFELHYGAWHKTHQELVQKLARINFLIDT